MLKVGDKITIHDDGNIYDTYNVFYEKYKTKETLPFGKHLSDNFISGIKGTVVVVAEHMRFKNKFVAIVNIEEKGVSILIGAEETEDIIFDERVIEKYIIKKVIPEYKYYEVTICGDSNDGDYITTEKEYSQNEFDEIIDALIDLKINYSEGHKLEDYPNEYDLSIPCSDCGYCHTLESLRVRMYDVDGSVYEVEF